jgi:hypothetical protein
MAAHGPDGKELLAAAYEKNRLAAGMTEERGAVRNISECDAPGEIRAGQWVF